MLLALFLNLFGSLIIPNQPFLCFQFVVDIFACLVACVDPKGSSQDGDKMICERYDSITGVWSIVHSALPRPPGKMDLSVSLSFVYDNFIWFAGMYC
jgi:hypothetical protein